MSCLNSYNWEVIDQYSNIASLMPAINYYATKHRLYRHQGRRVCFEPCATQLSIPVPKKQVIEISRRYYKTVKAQGGELRAECFKLFIDNIL